MPIKIPNGLPAAEVLGREHIFVMTEQRATTQHIRPLQLLVLNLMPVKITTETQLARVLGNTPLQVELELIKTSTYEGTHPPEEHMLKFYTTFDQVKDRYFDGMVITGAPVEKLEFEQVQYWQELCEIMEWTKTHVHSTFHICWAAQAALYYHYGINKVPLDRKLSGVYPHRVLDRSSMLMRGFDDVFMVPQSRNTTLRTEDVKACDKLSILAESDAGGVYAMSAMEGRQVFITGHSEYDADTLRNEYIRDKKIDPSTRVPENYFPNDDDTKEPVVTWRGHANLLYMNWLNYFVYQTTPYEIETIIPMEIGANRERKL